MLDKDIREPLFDYLDERYGKVRTIEEKIIGKSRADILAIVEGELFCNLVLRKGANAEVQRPKRFRGRTFRRRIQRNRRNEG